jgi:hypothetical protein
MGGFSIQVTDATNGSEDAFWTFGSLVAGSNQNQLKIGSGVCIGDSNSTLPGDGKLRLTAIELGHDTDTSLTRVSAGIAAVEGHQITVMDTENQPLTGGVTVTEKSLGTITTGTTTLDMGDRPMHSYTNGGAHTLAPGAVIGSTLVAITNNGSAGTITTSGWTKVSGDSFTTTNGHKFLCAASVSAVGSLLTVQAMQ